MLKILKDAQLLYRPFRLNVKFRHYGRKRSIATTFSE